jgi:hypothetical protein
VRTRITAALLAVHPILAVALATSAAAGVTAARPERAWVLATLPIAAVALGPRTRRRLTLALAELALIVPVHAWLTLLRAARLEGG